MRSALGRVAFLTFPALFLLWWLGPAWAGFLLGWAGLVYALVASISGDEAEARALDQIRALRSELNTFRDSADQAIGRVAEAVRELEPKRP